MIAVDKPAGWSSFDVIRYLRRRIINIKKMGHAGTLDPIATGVLLVFFGKATKAIPFLKNTDKEYIAKFRLGIKTTTLDITGEIIEKNESKININKIEKAIKNFEGKIEQTPPMFSAIKFKGTPLYKFARQGKTIERKKRDIVVKEINCLEFNEKEQEGKIKIYCSSGTYIRSLVFDIGEVLGVGATLLELKRTKACGFLIENCFTVENLQVLKDKKNLESAIISLETIFKDFDRIYLDENRKKLFLNGVNIKLSEDEKFSGDICVYYRDTLVGIAHKEGGLLNIDRVLI